MSNETQSRRRFLAGTAGATLTLGLAGCVSGEETGADGSTEDEKHTEKHEDETDTEHHEDETSDHDDGHGDEDTHSEHDEQTDEEGHGHDHDEGTPEEPSPTAHVTMETDGSEQHFKPHLAWVETGGTVTWEIESGQHNAVAYHPENGGKALRIPERAEPWSTGMLREEGETARHTFETEGVYDYCCTPHESVGMVGTVIVGEPDAHDQPALEDPQNSVPEGARNELTELGEKVNEALGHTH